MGWGIIALAGLQFGLQSYSIIEGAKDTKEKAKAAREDIALQKKSIELAEQAREMKEDLAEAKVRADLRRAQAKMLTRQAISGVESSSTFEAMKEGMVAKVQSGLATQQELSGIQTEQSLIQEERLDIAAGMISEPTDLDVMLNIAGASISAGMTAWMGMDGKKKKTTGRGVGLSDIDTEKTYKSPTSAVEDWTRGYA